MAQGDAAPFKYDLVIHVRDASEDGLISKTRQIEAARRMIRARSRKKTACRRLPLSLHNATRKGREDKEAVPITVKASHELAQTLVSELKKGVAFLAEDELAYYRNPETNRETYSRNSHSLKMVDSDLQRVINAWRDLPANFKAAILAIAGSG